MFETQEKQLLMLLLLLAATLTAFCVYSTCNPKVVKGCQP
jgi:hypothetical protein